jgi:hypothetical protein
VVAQADQETQTIRLQQLAVLVVALRVVFLVLVPQVQVVRAMQVEVLLEL